MENLKEQAYDLASEFIKSAKLKKGQIAVIGCSTSEICGSKIGTNSQYDVAEEVFEGIYKAFCENEIYLASQCCEHLNRAIIIERELAEKLNIDEVNVIPQPKAGGSFATTTYKHFKDPVAVEKIRADGGIDIGGTLIGMHLKEVAVPLRLSVKKLGEANILSARVRAKFVGGGRAIYNEDLM